MSPPRSRIKLTDIYPPTNSLWWAVEVGASREHHCIRHIVQWNEKIPPRVSISACSLAMISAIDWVLECLRKKRYLFQCLWNFLKRKSYRRRIALSPCFLKLFLESCKLSSGWNNSRRALIGGRAGAGRANDTISHRQRCEKPRVIQREQNWLAVTKKRQSHLVLPTLLADMRTPKTSGPEFEEVLR